MKNCPKCNNIHEKTGLYCSRNCANSRKFSEETKRIKSQKAKKYWDNLNPENKEKIILEKTSRLHLVRERYQKNYIPMYLREDVNFEDLSYDSQRKRIIFEQRNKCNRCHEGEWLDQPIPLEIDHIDGDRVNNIRINMEALCPNCHALTKTWRGRNKNKNKIPDKLFIRALEEAPNIRQALIQLGLSPKGSNYERAKMLLKLNNGGC